MERDRGKEEGKEEEKKGRRGSEESKAESMRDGKRGELRQREREKGRGVQEREGGMERQGKRDGGREESGGVGSSSNTNLNSSSPSSQPGAAPISPESRRDGGVVTTPFFFSILQTRTLPGGEAQPQTGSPTAQLKDRKLGVKEERQERHSFSSSVLHVSACVCASETLDYFSHSLDKPAAQRETPGEENTAQTKLQLRDTPRGEKNTAETYSQHRDREAETEKLSFPQDHQKLLCHPSPRLTTCHTGEFHPVLLLSSILLLFLSHSITPSLSPSKSVTKHSEPWCLHIVLGSGLAQTV
ncbi:hypothetical protein JZ751_014398 [Albula glossodonta]|uniref:Uncharacterized protein n=1 Tax=Albula glossodonta TaxID=121402 RepID=A0A8T2MLB7_9TELE|nr:hypothetical protein JZ751_014398 [Albula glossodonta]